MDTWEEQQPMERTWKLKYFHASHSVYLFHLAVPELHPLCETRDGVNKMLLCSVTALVNESTYKGVLRTFHL